LNEIVREGEAGSEIKRLREMTGDLCTHLHQLSASLAGIRPNTMGYLAAEFFEDLRAKLALEAPKLAAEVEWKSSLGEEALEIDPHLFQEAFLELFFNAATHERGKGGLVFESCREDESIEFILREPKTKFDGETENWGGRPFRRIRSGHYGLGLFRARSIFEAHHGTLRAQFDPAASSLVTTVSLPILMA